jgi:AcrR family transcriptional regulator
MTPAVAAPRGRRGPRTTGEDRERAILATAERLLAERGFDGFSVDDLARGAGLSRPTFYFYFASKDAVVLSLLDRVIDQAHRSTPVVDFADDPLGSWRAIIAAIVTVFDEHRAVTVAGAEAHAGSAEIRTLWSTAMERWVTETASLIKAERQRGAAPAGLPAHELAVALNLMNERVLAATFAGGQPGVAVDRVTDVLLAVWWPAIYGTTVPVH